MSSEHPQEASDSPANMGRQPTDDKHDNEAAGDHRSQEDTSGQQAMILVRGETIRDPESNSAPKDSQPQDSESQGPDSNNSQTKDAQSNDSKSKDSTSKDKSPSREKPRKEVSEAKAKLQSRLPALDDDADIGAQKEQVVTRDGKADLAFTGTLIASAAPPSAPKGKWKEYRIYETTAGKHVFSKVSRTIYVEDQDSHEAEVFDPSPSSVPSQLLRTARDLTRSRPMTWMDAAVAFFGYDPLAKELYRKIGGEFEEHIS